MARGQAEVDHQRHAPPQRPPRRQAQPAAARKPSASTPKAGASAVHDRSSARRSCASAGAIERVVGITAAMNSGTGLNILQEAMPERYFDVGIAEQQAILFAAGLALQG